MTNICITGCSGFVGSNLAVESLRGGDNEIYGLIRQRSDSKIPPRLEYTRFASNIHLISGDITDYYSCIRFLKEAQPDIIYHLASQSFVPESMNNPMATYDATWHGTLNMLEAMRNVCSNDCKFIFAGSSEEYGMQFDTQEDYAKYVMEHGECFTEPSHYPETPINEDNILRPQSPYAVAKMASDYACRNYFQTYGLKTIVARPFNIEGANRGAHFVTASIVRQLLQLKLGEIDHVRVGNTNSKRDWSHVDDVVDGYRLLAERGRVGEVYVMGSGVQYSIAQYIQMVDDELDSSSLGKVYSYPDLKRKTDVTNLVADASKIRKLGWEPKKTIKDIIRDLHHFYLVKEHRVNIL